MGAVAIIGIALTALTGTLTIDQSLNGFGNRVIWLGIGGIWWKFLGLW